jgi:hypothetical protein
MQLRSRLSEARLSDGLKAAEMLAKMCGWNEPERVNVQSVEVKVDAALMSSYEQDTRSLTSGARKHAFPCQAGPVSAVGPQQETMPHKKRRRVMSRPKLELESAKEHARHRLRVVALKSLDSASQSRLDS